MESITPLIAMLSMPSSSNNPDSPAAKAAAADKNATKPVTTAAADAPATETKEENSDPACFSAHATVELKDGSFVRMEDLSIGDVVRVGAFDYSPVFMFTHKLSGGMHTFVTLRTASGAALSATSGHYIYANGQLVAAGSVKMGDVLTLGNGQSDVVESVKSGTARGLYNPQKTAHGSIVVDGILASTYTTAVQPEFAHAVLSPLRALNWFGLSVRALESGGGALTGVMPRGEHLM